MDRCCKPGSYDPIIPQRSTFCFKHDTRAYLNFNEIMTMKKQWDTYERVENYNSIVYSTIVGLSPPLPATPIPPPPLPATPIPPPPLPATPTPVIRPSTISTGSANIIFYNFQNQEELLDYNQGKLQHIAEYPDVSDFCVPYSKKPTNIAGVFNSNGYFIEKSIKSNLIDNSERLTNTTGRNLYVLVSTQKSLFPKSPYKFSGNDEYLLYKRYESNNC